MESGVNLEFKSSDCQLTAYIGNIRGLVIFSLLEGGQILNLSNFVFAFLHFWPTLIHS